jgi:FAD/FMN-containing dehydrogenase
MKNTRDAAAEPAIAEDAPRPTFSDWASVVSFQPPMYYRPRSLDELKGYLTNILQGAYKPGSLRVLGSLHSCSDVCVSDAVLDVSDLPKTMEFSDDYSVVTVSANWHLHDFLLALSAHGKALSATGGTDKQTLAWIISTNTAPATPRHTIYELVEWIEYITIDPKSNTVVERHVGKSDPGFTSVVGSLGAIGILTRIQFKLVPETYYEVVQKVVKLKEILADLAQTSSKYDFWRIDWIPDTDDGLLWAARMVPQADPNGDYPSDQSENILKADFNMLDKVESAGPLLDNSMRVIYAGLSMAYGTARASGPLRTMLPVDRRAPLHVAMAEWSFDPADLDRVLEACREYFHRHGWPNIPIEIELTKTDNYLMSAWNWPGLEYIVKFNFMYLTDISGTPVEKEQIISHLHGLWDYFLQAGIPFKAHWGKLNFMDYAFVSKNYALEQFAPSIHPLFVNKYLAERLWPTL